MNNFFPIPLYSFFKTAYKYGGFSGRGFLHALPWIVKAAAVEPLRWIELMRYSGKVESYKIEKDPLFILGYYRSGTTYLQQMFMQDNRLGYTSFYQTMFPELMLTFERTMTPVLEKLAQAFRTQNHFHRILFTWHFPGEEDVAMLSLMNAEAAQWGVLFPYKAMDTFTKYALFEKISNDELQDWKNNYLYLVKKISLANQRKPLVLKSPLNTARIEQLLSLFPNAKFIYISRNPVHVYASCKRLWEMINTKYVFGNYTAINLQQIISETYSGTMNSYMKDKLLIPQGRLIEISYENFIKRPVETLQQVYEKLELGDFEYCKDAMYWYVHEQKNYRTLEHALNKYELNTIPDQLDLHIKNWKEIQQRTLYEMAT
ncbi:MAG: sulfotransferase [Ginsengibacter sp.]